MLYLDGNVSQTHFSKYKEENSFEEEQCIKDFEVDQEKSNSLCFRSLQLRKRKKLWKKVTLVRRRKKMVKSMDLGFLCQSKICLEPFISNSSQLDKLLRDLHEIFRRKVMEKFEFLLQLKDTNKLVERTTRSLFTDLFQSKKERR